MSSTLYARRFDTDDIIFRLARFAGMGAILWMRGEHVGSNRGKATVFAASYLAGRLVLVGLYWRAWRHVTDARTTIGVYLIAMIAVAALGQCR